MDSARPNAQGPRARDPAGRFLPLEDPIAGDPEAEPLFRLFRNGDRCGDCGRLLYIRRTDSATCRNCGDEPIPF